MSASTYTLTRSSSDDAADVGRASSADLHLALACLLVATGGVLLGVQFDTRREVVGTGWTPLAIGALAALVVTFLQGISPRRVPRDAISGLSALCGFAGLAFVIAGVLAPGGPWMFAELFLLLWLLARRKKREQTSGPELLGSSLFALAFLLLFRLWITYQGSQHEWQLVEIDVPIVSWIPWDFLAPIQTVSLGVFTPRELGLPETGLHLPLSLSVWAAGFALCAAGLAWRSQAEMEHENDRVHATIWQLPGELAALVEQLLPEEDWYRLGLHGLPDRLRQKRLLTLVRETIAERAQFHEAVLRGSYRVPEIPPGFPTEVLSAVERYALPRPASSEAQPTDLDESRP